MTESEHYESGDASAGGTTCPFCGRCDSQPFDGDSWWCPNCNREYPTRAHKCRYPGCWEYVFLEEYCKHHKPARNKT